MMNRRDFLRNAGLAAVSFGLLPPAAILAEDVAPRGQRPPGADYKTDDERFVRPAMFYRKLPGNVVECRLCPRHCRVEDGKRGQCGVRENRGGEYYTLVYGRTVALNNDPIEKKPFYHFRPGTMVLSLATAGCNISCKFCQNWQISQFRPEKVESTYLPPEEVLRLASRHQVPNIALTYSEPTIFYEYLYDVARLSHQAGIKCVVVSNGYTSPEAVKKLAPFLAAYKVDLKAFTEEFYQVYCSAHLEPVLTTLKTLTGLAAQGGPWLEIVNLVLPTANDSEKQIRAMAAWIKSNLGDTVPIHFTRFYPMYKMLNLPPTPVQTLEACHKAARAEGLKYVYVGNVPGHPLGNTLCHGCGRLLIERTGLWAVESRIKDGRCPQCHTRIPGVWS